MSPRKRPPSRAELLEHQTSAALAGLDQTLTVRRMIRHVRVTLADEGILEVAEDRFRLLPDGEWQRLTLNDPHQAIELRAQVARRLANRRAAPVDRGGHATAPKHPPTPHMPDAWADALAIRGVPTSLENGVVVVSDIGEVEVPEGERSLKKAARAFVSKRTEESLDWLFERTAATLRGLPEVSVRTSKRRVVIRHGQEDVGTVKRYQVIVGGKVRFLGDLREDASGWRELRYAIRALVEQVTVRSSQPLPASAPAPVPEPAPGPERTLARVQPAGIRFDLPATLSREARSNAMAASARLRHERRLVPATTVEVPTPQGTLTFAPLDDTANPLEARFTFVRSKDRFEGGLRLKRPDDPLSLRVGTAARDALLGEAWAAALIVYAELTCSKLSVDEEPSDQPSMTPRAVQRRLSPRPTGEAVRRRKSRSSRAAAARVVSASSLREAIELMQSVSGHLRRLQPGSAASDDGRRAAERAGIHLPDGYTWVRPHHRGRERRVRIEWPRDAPLW